MIDHATQRSGTGPGAGDERREDLAGALSRALGRQVPRPGDGVQRPPAPPAAAGGARRKLWQLPGKYHCSLLGVCLDIDEMRRLAAKMGLPASPEVSDFQIHHNVAYLAGFPDRQGRRLQRHLAEKYTAAVRELRDCRDEAALRAAWRRLRDEADLGAAYWALLTHPCASPGLCTEAHEHVHMLSHRAAAELRQARARAAALEARALEQERLLQRERVSRTRLAGALQRLRREAADRDALVREVEARRAHGPAPEQTTTSRSIAAEPDEVQRLRTRLATAGATAREWRRLYRQALCLLVEGDGATAEAGAATPRRSEPGSPVRAAHGCTAPCDLAGRCVAYVGGHDRVIPRLRELTRRCNGRFVHHDGGVSERPALIDENVTGSDVVLVPLDCVSHDACRRLKRCCRRTGTPIVWLHSASVSAFEAALSRLGESGDD